jgi:ribosomal protein L9
MICSQLQYLQQNFAALLAASDEQEQLERLGVALADDKEAVRAFRERLQERLTAVGTRLAAHVQEHGCAN